MFHLTARVAWHDSAWNGHVCKAPSCNAYCVALDRIRELRDETAEEAVAGRPWNELKYDQLPACKAESGAFMSPHEWSRRFDHPYAEIEKTSESHGHLKPTVVQVPPYATFAVPFNWMLRDEQKGIESKLPNPLPDDDESPFNTSWVFGKKRQEAILNLFFDRLIPEKSLVFFYCKEGQPLGDTISRLVVGVGRITHIAPISIYDVKGNKPGYPMWDRLVRHSIRPEGTDGFLLPYHQYLEPTGDPAEDERRLELLREIAVAADAAHVRTFSFAAELAASDIALSVLIRCLETVRKIREHGIAKGPWSAREEWLNEQISLTWKDRGAFPGLGPALEALGMRLGTALVLESLSSGALKPEDDPWPLVDALLQGKKKPPSAAYNADLKAVAKTWINLGDERRSLLKLLSRFALTSAQMKRCYDTTKRDKGFSAVIKDHEIIENPYRICELDLGDWDDSPVSVGSIDRGLLPDSTIAAKHPVPSPSAVDSQNDPRRIRAAIVSVLREGAASGDSLLSVTEALQRLERAALSHPININADWPATNQGALEGMVELVEIPREEPVGSSLAALQLTDLLGREKKLRSILSKRALKALPTLGADWEKMLVQAIQEAGGKFDSKNERHASALAEQVIALEKITRRRLSVLVGRAGTGKTSVMGALMLCESLAKDGILFLAPTGKARVRLGRATNETAMTVAQFLNQLKRYDGPRQRPLFSGEEKYRKEKTVVVDECSMLTMDDLAAILEALDLAHVQRLILVGDPNQLPPIGVGRPFADLAVYLETSADSDAEDNNLDGALARLTVEVRATASETVSDTLRLASWFTRERQSVDADRVLSDLEMSHEFNDLQLLFWNNSEELRARLLDAFQKHLGLKNSHDIAGFDKSLGLDEMGWVPFENPGGSEYWQLLSPVRMQSHGVVDLNRWLQRQFRAKQLDAAANPWVTKLGDESIVLKDKVIQVANQRRKAYDGKENAEYYLANGEVGLVATGKSGFLNVLFAGRPNLRFGYSGRDFPGNAGPLQLAYALTVHKAQGSEFKKVFVVLPKNCRLLSRELLYTALTRSREQLVLLIEGSDASILFDLTRPEKSETSRRNTNLFQGIVRTVELDVPYAQNLIHRTSKGHLVRSKSELVIANILHENGITYEYERVCEGSFEPGRLRPDFSFTLPDGDLIIWEHLGMMDREDYRKGWEWKRQWYIKNGYIEGSTLFSSEEKAGVGLNTDELKQVALRIKALLTDE